MIRNVLILLTFLTIISPGCNRTTDENPEKVVRRHLAAGRTDRAISYLKARLSSSPDEKTVLLLADILIKNSDFREASKVLSEYVGKNEASSKVWYMLGYTRHQERKDEAAADALVQALKLDPKNIDAIELLGRIYEVNDAERQAEALYLRVARDTSYGRKLVPVLLRLASIEVRKGRYDEAEMHLRTALRIDPGNPAASEKLALLLVRKGSLSDAVKVIDGWEKHHSGDAKAFLMKGRLLRKMGKYEEALVQFRKSVELDDQDPAVLTEISDLLFTTGKYEKAFKYLVKAVALDPQSKPVNRMLAPLYYVKGMTGAAWKALEAWGDRSNPKYWMLKARILEEQGDYAGAYDSAMKVLTLVTKPSAALRAWAGIIAREAGHYKRAVTLLTGALGSRQLSDPLLSFWGVKAVPLTQRRLQRNLAISLFMTGQKNNARKILKKLMKSGDTMAGIWLAALHLQKRNTRKALRILAKISPQTDVERLFYHDVKAQCYELTGALDLALQELSRMIPLARSTTEKQAIESRVLTIQKKLGQMDPSQLQKRIMKRYIPYMKKK